VNVHDNQGRRHVGNLSQAQPEDRES
jgi:hypothetical protein